MPLLAIHINTVYVTSLLSSESSFSIVSTQNAHI